MPPLIPVTIPVALTDPTPGLTLLHVPPPVASVSAVVAPTHTVPVPVTGAGAAGSPFTDTIFVTVLPPRVYDIVATPAAVPVTVADVPMPATVANPLPPDQVPPAVASVSVTPDPTHTVDGPDIPVNSVIAALVLFHLSPASCAPLPLTAFNMEKKVTPPEPATGAVHVAETLYVVPAVPVPVTYPPAVPSAPVCSTILRPTAVTVCVPAVAVSVPEPDV